MKILIADDEELVRVGLRDIIHGIVPEARVCEAVNGRTMIEAVKKHRPDVCFTDIRMPGINGLDAIEQLADAHSSTSWIILSGYSDFEYARKALALGAIEYLLKPATVDEVAAALNKAEQKRKNDGLKKREKFEYRISGVLNYSSAAEFDDYIMQIGKYAAIVFISDLDDVDELMNQQKELFCELRNLINRRYSNSNVGIFNILDGYPAVISGGDESEKLLHELMGVFTESMMLHWSLIVSPSMYSLSDLISYFKSAAEFNADSIPKIVNDSKDKSSKIVRQAEKLVLEQYKNPIGVAQIAEQLNVTPNYLSSLFKKYKNECFTKFITDIRLSEAPKLLETPGITVKEAASKLGYMSSRHFARLFREKYGMPPSDYYRK